MNREFKTMWALFCCFFVGINIYGYIRSSKLPPDNGICIITNGEYILQDDFIVDSYASYDTDCQSNLTSIDEADQQLFSYRFDNRLKAKKYVIEVLMTSFNKTNKFACYDSNGTTAYIENKKLRCED